MKVRIITDSTADLTPEVRGRLDVVPLTICFGQAEYVDGVTITHKEFYEKLVESDVLPTTSQASPEAFSRAFHAALAEHDAVVAITVSSRLSGTCQSAMIAAAEFPGRVFVVDSQSVAIGAGILAEYALSLAEQGMEAPELAAELERKRQDVRVVAMLDTLEYLKKGGRISSAAAFAGGLLSIKPVLSLEGGEIRILGRARGSRQAGNLLVGEIEKAGGVDFGLPVLLGYTGLSDALLEKYKADSSYLWKESRKPLRSTLIGSVVGTHAGPGAVAVAFFRKQG